jgi:3D (Asp-Asp-Asp) domain-containing protein
MWAQKDVTVVVDGRTVRVQTHANDVAEVLAEANVAADHSDVITPSPSSDVESGDTVVVRHSVPVTVDLGTREVEVDVVGETVADALVAAGAETPGSESVTPSLDEPLEPGMKITVPALFTRITSEEQTLTPQVELQPDSSLPKGERRVITNGSPGKVLNVYRIVVQDGVESSPTLTARKVLDRSVPRIVAVGTGARSGLQPASFRSYRVPKPPKHGRKMRVETTAYSPREPGLDFVTATGARARHGVIAVDPRVIPLGTHVYVPGYGYAVAADTGGAIKGRRVDLCFETVAECIRWGRRHVTIIILD